MVIIKHFVHDYLQNIYLPIIKLQDAETILNE